MYDLVVIGGGINGCGSAADAALRGLNVLLCEADDIASKTSSKSSKLIHGGLRYLEHYDLALVKKALDEQQILTQIAPHLVHPIPFVLPYQQQGRPLWLLRAGLFLYDHLSRINTLPNSDFIDKIHHKAYFSPLVDDLNKGFMFYDCQTDDVRLTIANALQAAQHGATITTQTALINAIIKNNLWQLTLKPHQGDAYQVTTKAVINAAGPWVSSVNDLLGISPLYNITLVKGSHLLIHKLYEGNHAYLLQNDDERIVFVIPYQGFTMIGTTDVLFTGNPKEVTIDPAEIDYLIKLVNHHFKQQCNKKDIVTTWSGVRPLLSSNDKTPSALSRDYIYHYSTLPAPAIAIYGGKITTYRQLAAQVIDQLKPIFPNLPPSITYTTPLPGATLDNMSIAFHDYGPYAREKYHWLAEDILQHYLLTYGTLTERILNNCHQMEDLGIQFDTLLYQIEIDYLLNEEWATSIEDILWRRTKFGFSINTQRDQALRDYILKSMI